MCKGLKLYRGGIFSAAVQFFKMQVGCRRQQIMLLTAAWLHIGGSPDFIHLSVQSGVP